MQKQKKPNLSMRKIERDSFEFFNQWKVILLLLSVLLCWSWLNGVKTPPSVIDLNQKGMSQQSLRYKLRSMSLRKGGGAKEPSSFDSAVEKQGGITGEASGIGKLADSSLATTDRDVEGEFLSSQDRFEFLENLLAKEPDLLVPLIKAQLNLSAELKALIIVTRFLELNPSMIKDVENEIKALAADSLRQKNFFIKSTIIESIAPLLIANVDNPDQATERFHETFRGQFSDDLKNILENTFHSKFPNFENQAQLNSD